MCGWNFEFFKPQARTHLDWERLSIGGKLIMLKGFESEIGSFEKWCCFFKQILMFSGIFKGKIAFGHMFAWKCLLEVAWLQWTEQIFQWMRRFLGLKNAKNSTILTSADAKTTKGPETCILDAKTPKGHHVLTLLWLPSKFFEGQYTFF